MRYTKDNYKGVIESYFTVKVIGKVTNSARDAIKHKCLVCNKTFKTNRYNMVEKIKGHRESGCPYCQKEITAKNISNTLKRKIKTGEVKKSTTRFSPVQYRTVCKKKNILPLEDFVNMRKSIKHKCMICGYRFDNSPSNIIYQNGGCGKCRNKIKKSLVQYKEELAITNIGWIPLEYKGARVPSKHRCGNCGYEKSMTPDNVVRRQYPCPKCMKTKTKVVNVGGFEFEVRGFEDIALDYLRQQGVDLGKISNKVKDGLPTFTYKFKNKKHKYIPDFFYAKSNLVIEVKSTYTLGLDKNNIFSGAGTFYRNCAKARAVIRKGYRYKMLLLTVDGRRIKLPKDWYNQSFRSISARVRKSSPSCKSSAYT